jgi:hypothetical protein
LTFFPLGVHSCAGRPCTKYNSKITGFLWEPYFRLKLHRMINTFSTSREYLFAISHFT